MFRSKGIDPEIVALRERATALETLSETLRVEFNKVWAELKDLRAEVQLLQKQPPLMWANAPLHVTEDEEDAKWQLDNGMIEKKEYEELLQQLGLEPKVETIHY